MKDLATKLTLLALTLNCSAAYARSSNYAENGWVNGFYFGQDAASRQVPSPGSTEAEPENT